MDAHQSGDEERIKAAKYRFRSGVRDAKRRFKEKLDEDISSASSRDLWRGTSKVTGYKPKSKGITDDDSTLPDRFNQFYSRFDRPVTTTPPNAVESNPPLIVMNADTRRVLSNLKTNKAAGPDGISPRLLRNCASELSGILTVNWSLGLCRVPHVFKKSNVIPVPKRSPITPLNDYRLVALTSIVMKCFERLVMYYLKNVISHTLDPFQFAYRSNRSVDDAVSLTLHNVTQHLDQKRASAYARLLFIDLLILSTNLSC